MSPEVPELFVHWEQFMSWLLDHTEKFPRRLRPTLTARIENCALDVFERIVAARYTRVRAPILERLNLDLERLRLLLRLACGRRALSLPAFEYACEQVDLAGRMVGGWRRAAGRSS